MEDGAWPDTLSSETLIELVGILKNGKMSTLRQIEPFILETSIADIFLMVFLQRFTERRNKFHVPVGRSR